MDLFDEALQENAIVSKSIKKVTVQSYRNIPYKEYVLNGNSLLLSGKNGIGKTNVLEAILWALSGVLFNGVVSADGQGQKPYDSEKDVVTSVKIEFMHNSYSFERRIKEVWDKDGITKKGTETTLLVNGGACKDQTSATNSALDYLGMSGMQARFSKNPILSKTNLFTLLYNAQALRNMDYKELRAIITDMVGETDFKTIINENPEKYMKLVQPLRDHGMDLQALKTDTRSKIFDEKSGFNKQASDLTANIKAFDEKGKSVVDADALKTAKEEIVAIDKDISELEKRKQTSSADLVRQYDSDITAEQNKIYERQNVLRKEHEDKLAKLKNVSLEKDLESKQKSQIGYQQDRIDLNEKISKKETGKSKADNSLKSKRSDLEQYEKEIAQLKVDYRKLSKPENVDHFTCPKCKATFSVVETVEYQETAKPKLETIAKDGINKAQQIKDIKAEIEQLEIDLEVFDGAIVELQKQRTQLDDNIKALSDDILVVQGKLKEQKDTLPVLDLENDSEIVAIKGQIGKIKESKQTALNNYDQHISDINVKIDELKAKKQPFTDTVNLESNARSYQQSADESREKLKAVNFKLQEQKDIETLCKEVEKEMYSKLDEKVQNVFGKNFQFKLWKLNVTNGEYDTRMCEIYVRDIDNHFVNIKNINTGMFPIRATEFIETIKKYYCVEKSFIFVDELGTLDESHREMVKTFGEQIFATQVGESATVQEKLF